MKILLVEDSRSIRRENEAALFNAGYDVICAEDGESAIELAREQNPNLILLDMILPKLSGPEVLQRLKSDARTAHIPVIVVSSLSEKNREKLLEAGAEEYLEKNLLMPRRGVNLLPKAVDALVRRIGQKRGRAFSATPQKL